MFGLGIYEIFFMLGILTILTIVGMWKVFKKAGKPGWISLIPFYNIFVFLKITNKPAWWIIFWIIPIFFDTMFRIENSLLWGKLYLASVLINLLFQIIVYISLAKKFNKGILFGLGLTFLPFIFFLILGFDKSEYNPSS